MMFIPEYSLEGLIPAPTPFYSSTRLTSRPLPLPSPLLGSCLALTYFLILPPHYFFFFLAEPHSTWDLSSPMRKSLK